MTFGNFCVPSGMGGPGAGCDAADVFSCSPHLVCVELGMGATCHALCTVAAPMCGGGEVCAPFSTQEGDPADVGACVTP
jgi:hypothetical protein